MHPAIIITQLKNVQKLRLRLEPSPVQFQFPNSKDFWAAVDYRWQRAMATAACIVAAAAARRAHAGGGDMSNRSEVAELRRKAEEKEREEEEEEEARKKMNPVVRLLAELLDIVNSTTVQTLMYVVFVFVFQMLTETLRNPKLEFYFD